MNGTTNNSADSLYWIWGDGDSTLYTTPGANINHTYLSSGPYTVCLRAWNSCGMDQSCLTNIVSGIEQENQNTQIVCYPNPFNKTFTIKTSTEFIGGSIQLYGLPGKLILNTQIKGTQTTIETSNIKSGIYLLKIISRDGDVSVKKIVKR